ncbi:hypothetical protein QYF48_12105 [Brevibacillus agri]|uniref:hypothetical protein n=1 Tax=Brevibacillus agri TaxID=51101 RepID=UPI0025B65A2C|nr:hypothetical protein [Brevibacillus agri]MDN4093558.1 hypothetical protein [Brevibacillus agri]
MTTMVKPIEQTTALSGKFAQDFIKDAYKKPSISAIEKNQRAVQLLKKLRG